MNKVQARASARDVSKTTATVIAKARKKFRLPPAIEIRGRNTTIGVIVEQSGGPQSLAKTINLGVSAARRRDEEHNVGAKMIRIRYQTEKCRVRCMRRSRRIRSHTFQKVATGNSKIAKFIREVFS